MTEFHEHANIYDSVLEQDKRYKEKYWLYSVDVDFYLCSVKCIYFINKSAQDLNCMVPLLEYTRI